MVINGPKGVAKMNIWLFVRFHAGTLFGEIILNGNSLHHFSVKNEKKLKMKKNVSFVVTW